MGKTSGRMLEQEKNYDPSSALPLLDIMKSEQRQKYEADAGVWIISVLRMESGGNITPKEQSAYENYFLPSIKDKGGVRYVGVDTGLRDMYAEHPELTDIGMMSKPRVPDPHTPGIFWGGIRMARFDRRK